MIDKSTIDRVFDTANVVDVVGDFVNLRKRGVNYLGLCPFHNEKTPSFTVSPAKNIYKCFGCGKGGNPVNFIMDHESLGYYEAIKWLAKRYNIEVIEKEKTPEDIKRETETESMLVVSSFAGKYFINNLHKHSEGKNIGLTYFREREFTDEIINKFELGYSLDQSDALTNEAQKQGYKIDYLIKTGLVIQREEGQIFDRFRGRVMFPIHSLSGKIIGFGGRILKKNDKMAKYLNSPESEIYHKSKVLYGLYQAKKAITQNEKCFMVEGYTDVMSFHQSGIENVVASSGTSLTEDQIRLIKRFTNNLTIIYDGDQAGIKASLRGIDMVLEQGLNVKIVLLPDGEDPDSFAKQKSSQELTNYISENETDFIRFKSKLLANESENDPVKRAELISDITRSISVIPDGIVRSVYIKECAGILDVDERVLYSEINKKRRKELDKKYKREKYSGKEANPSIPEKKHIKEISSTDKDKLREIFEREIIRFLILYGNQIIYTKEYENDFGDIIEENTTAAQYIISEINNDKLVFKNKIFEKTFSTILQEFKKEKVPDERFFINHEDSQISTLSIELLSPGYELSELWKRYNARIDTEDKRLRKTVPEILLRFKLKNVEEEIEKITRNLKNITPETDLSIINDLQKQIVEKNNIKRAIIEQIG